LKTKQAVKGSEGAVVICSVEISDRVVITRESKKLSALLFFQFIYTKVGVEQVRHFST
jgi:hypothetical protein